MEARAPRYLWRPNPGGEVRTVHEAVKIAKRWGVVIPEYVSFHRRPICTFAADTFVRGTKVKLQDHAIVRWETLFNARTEKMPFHVRADVFGSDEAKLKDLLKLKYHAIADAIAELGQPA